MDKVRWIRVRSVMSGIAVTSATVALPAALFLLPGAVHAQDVTIVSNQVSVSDRDATLKLELNDGKTLEVVFRNGSVEIDGSAIGTFVRNDALDTAWRNLLGSAVGVSNGPLAELLAAWERPESLEGADARTATALDEALDAFVAETETVAASAAAAAATAASEATAAAIAENSRQVEQQSAEFAEQGARISTSLSTLLRSRELLELLGDLDDLGLDLDDVRVSIGDDLTIRRGETVNSDVLVFGGDLDVRGEVDGNVVAADGRVRLYESGVIRGDVRLADATFHDYGGELEGRRSRIRPGREDEYERMRDELRSEIRDELRDEFETEFRESYDWGRGGGLFNPLRHFWAGLMGLFQNVLTFGILAAVGAILMYFNHERMAEVVETARTSTAKSTMVGVAGSFMFFPVWILGIVVLTISIIGIPALLLWIPLFPLLGGFAALFGTFAVAAVIGDWAQGRRFRFLEWADDPNLFYRMVSGLLVLTALFAGANVLRMGGPLLGFFHGVLAFIACLVAIGTMLTGFGAVLLTWSNHRAQARAAGVDADWSWRSWTTPDARKSHDAAAEATAAAAAAAEGAEDIVAEDAAADVVDTVIDDIEEALTDAGQAIDDVLDEVIDGGADDPDDPATEE